MVVEDEGDLVKYFNERHELHDYMIEKFNLTINFMQNEQQIRVREERIKYYKFSLGFLS